MTRPDRMSAATTAETVRTEPPLDRARAVAMAAVLSALADPIRLMVFRAVRDSGQRGAALRDVLAPEGDRAIVREALAQLEAVGLVHRRRDHAGRRYVIDAWTLASFSPLIGGSEDHRAGPGAAGC